jgi:hypothetical protein
LPPIFPWEKFNYTAALLETIRNTSGYILDREVAVKIPSKQDKHAL